MFDICSCTCYDREIESSGCQCKQKIPIKEWMPYVQSGAGLAGHDRLGISEASNFSGWATENFKA